MKFLNIHVRYFSLIALVASIVFFPLLNYVISIEHYNIIWLVAGLYGTVLFLSGFFLGRQDMYEGFYGFNYHWVTYIICNAVPLALVALGFLPEMYIRQTLLMMAFWGFGLLLHAICFLILRKRSIRGLDKGDVFA